MRLPQLANLRAGEPPHSVVARAVGYPYIDDAIDAGIGPGMQDCVIKNAVHGDSGADAEGERKNGGERKAEIAENLPQRKTEILEQYLHAYLLSRGTGKDESAVLL